MPKHYATKITLSISYPPKVVLYMTIIQKLSERNKVQSSKRRKNVPVSNPHRLMIYLLIFSGWEN